MGNTKNTILLSSMMKDMMISEIFNIIKLDRFNNEFILEELYFNETLKVKITINKIAFEGFLAQKFAHHFDCMGCFFKYRSDSDDLIELNNPKDVLKEVELEYLALIYKKLEESL